MVYKRFTLFLLIRLAVILLLMIGISLIYIFMEKGQMVFTFLVLSVLLLILVLDLIRYVNTTNRMLARFLLSIRHEDFTIHFNSGKSKSSISELNSAFQEIIDAFQQIKTEKEVQFNFLNNIVEIMPVGIIAIDNNEHISLMNSAAEDLLGIRKPSNWSQLAKKIPAFTAAVDDLKNSGKLLHSTSHGERGALAVELNTTLLLGSEYKIITIKNIKTEIDLKETEAWIKLIRTLNHEIMNSVTPISSLTDTILLILQDAGKDKPIEKLEQQNISDVSGSVKTIQTRSNRLIGFVEEYRKLTKVPAPQKEKLNVLNLLKSVSGLLKAELEKRNISIHVESDEDLEFDADPILMEQVLINLLRNSMDAINNRPDASIELRAYVNDDYHVCISVADNGTGIPEEIRDEIFTPFFTTKDFGSGIGLSLSRQIMRLHGGSISFESTKDQTLFSLVF